MEGEEEMRDKTDTNGDPQVETVDQEDVSPEPTGTHPFPARKSRTTGKRWYTTTITSYGESIDIELPVTHKVNHVSDLGRLSNDSTELRDFIEQFRKKDPKAESTKFKPGKNADLQRTLAGVLQAAGATVPLTTLCTLLPVIE